MRIKNHYYLSIALHLASLWNRGLSQLGNSPHWWGLICLLHCSAHSNLQLALCFFAHSYSDQKTHKNPFWTLNSKSVWKLEYLRCNRQQNLCETVYSNSVTSENKTIQPPISFLNSKLGHLFFSTGSLNSSTTMHGGDGGGKGIFFPFEVYKASERPLSAKCLSKFCRRLCFLPSGPNAKN